MIPMNRIAIWGNAFYLQKHIFYIYYSECNVGVLIFYTKDNFETHGIAVLVPTNKSNKNS